MGPIRLPVPRGLQYATTESKTVWSGLLLSTIWTVATQAFGIPVPVSVLNVLLAAIGAKEAADKVAQAVKERRDASAGLDDTGI